MRIKRVRDSEGLDIFERYIQAKKAEDLAKQRVSELEEKLLAYMAEHQRKTLTIETEDGIKFSGTYTQRTTTQLNEDGLRKALGARVWNKYTIRKLDRKALEQAMTAGDVDPVTVAQYAEDVPGKVYLTYRERAQDEPTDS